MLNNKFRLLKQSNKAFVVAKNKVALLLTLNRNFKVYYIIAWCWRAISNFNQR